MNDTNVKVMIQSPLISCLKEIRNGAVDLSRLNGDVYMNAYVLLCQKEKSLIDNIFNETFKKVLHAS